MRYNAPLLKLSEFWPRLSFQKDLFCTVSPGQRGFKPIAAADPVDRLELFEPDEAAYLSFFRKHRQRLVAGYLGFELGYPLLGLPARPSEFPLVVLNAYDHFADFSKLTLESQAWLESLPKAGAIQPPMLNLQLSIDKEDYFKMIRRIKADIRAGEYYQLNLTFRLKGKTSSKPTELFTPAIGNPQDYTAFFDCGPFQLLSLSPEGFIHTDKGLISTEPIKGTAQRGCNAFEDKAFEAALLASKKEAAELNMITDLLRNDLGKIAKVGSVKVTKEREIQKLPEIQHSFSKIEARLKDGLEPEEALWSMMPGGSISGCPKRRSLESIRLFEPEARGPYTGSIGYRLPSGETCFSIAIRTLIQRAESLSLGVGGGITLLSEPEAELAECLNKANSFVKSLHVDIT